MRHGTRQHRVELKKKKTRTVSLSPAEIRDDETRKPITKIRSPWLKRGAFMFWSVWREDTENSEKGNLEKVWQGGDLIR